MPIIGRILVSFFQVVMVLTIQRLRQSLFSNIKLSVRKAAKVCWDYFQFSDFIIHKVFWPMGHTRGLLTKVMQSSPVFSILSRKD